MTRKQIYRDNDEMNVLFGCNDGEYVSGVEVFFDNIGGCWVMDAEILKHNVIEPIEELPF